MGTFDKLFTALAVKLPPVVRLRARVAALQAEVEEKSVSATTAISRHYADAVTWERIRWAWRQQRIEAVEAQQHLERKIAEMQEDADALRDALLESDLRLAAAARDLRRATAFNDDLMRALNDPAAIGMRGGASSFLDTGDRTA